MTAQNKPSRPMKYKPQFMAKPKAVVPYSILDANGKLRKGAKAPMSDARALEALRIMILGRGVR